MAQLTIDQALSIAVEHHRSGRFAEAEKLYCQVLATQNDCVDALHLLGVLLKQTNRFPEAEQLLRRAGQLAPDNAVYLTNLGMLLTAQGRFAESVAIYRQALACRPQSAELRNLLADDLNELGNQSYDAGGWDAAIEHYESAVKLRPEFADAWNNLGNALYETAEYDRAIECYKTAGEILPDNPDTRWNLSLVRLLLGLYREGWKDYEARWQLTKFAPHLRDFHQPLWQGESIAGKTILLHAEQGLGDAVQFVRYAAMVQRRGGKIVLEVQQALVRLFKNSFPNIDVIARGSDLPFFDLHCPLMSLPRIFETECDTVPAADGYLTVPNRQPANDTKLNIAIVWSGSRQHQKNRDRSVPLSMFRQLINPQIQFHGLQVGEPLGDFPAIDHAGELTDFADTAAVLADMDLLITVDTAVAHLGGALGKPTWVLLQHSPDWRWLLNRDDSPWYSSVRLFRQPSPGDWQSAVSNVADALAKQFYRHF